MQAPPPKKSNVALILIILGIIGAVVFLVIVIVVVLGIYGTRKYLVEAKKAEGKNTVAAIGRGMVACMEREESPPSTKPRELPPSAPPVPASVPKGAKYMSSPSDWTSPAFTCAKFSMSMPQYFQYEWERVSPLVGVVHARADFDGDGALDAQIDQEIRCKATGECTAGPLIEK